MTGDWFNINMILIKNTTFNFDQTYFKIKFLSFEKSNFHFPMKSKHFWSVELICNYFTLEPSNVFHLSRIQRSIETVSSR